MPLFSIKSKYYFIIFALSLLDLAEVIAKSPENGSHMLSTKEQQALQMLRPMVTDALYMDYMREDTYLIMWLKTFNLDVSKANKAIRKAHQWRHDKKIDTILSEDDSKVRRALPYDLSGYDLEGRPVAALPIGSWDIRKLMLIDSTQFNFFLIRLSEIAALNSRQGFNSTEGKARGTRDFPDWTMLINLQGYNSRQHACLACVRAMLTYLTEWNYYFPELTTIHAINAPRIFENLLQVLRSVLSERTDKATRIYGTNSMEWSAVLLKTISPDQLRPSFGGTKKH